MEVKLDMIRRFESGDSKAKIGWDPDLHKAVTQAY